MVGQGYRGGWSRVHLHGYMKGKVSIKKVNKVEAVLKDWCSLIMDGLSRESSCVMNIRQQTKHPENKQQVEVTQTERQDIITGTCQTFYTWEMTRGGGMDLKINHQTVNKTTMQFLVKLV